MGLKSPQFTLDGLNAEAPVNVEYLGPELSGAPYLHQGRLQVLDRVKFWPGAGEAGLGRAVAIYDVHPEAWFFKAHFFQDPVQPGSLGLEAMQQCARAAARLAGVADGATHFEQVAHDQSFDWSFRGQVTPLAVGLLGRGDPVGGNRRTRHPRRVQRHLLGRRPVHLRNEEDGRPRRPRLTHPSIV